MATKLSKTANKWLAVLLEMAMSTAHESYKWFEKVLLSIVPRLVLTTPSKYKARDMHLACAGLTNVNIGKGRQFALHDLRSTEHWVLP